MTAKITWGMDFWQEWRNDPQATAEKYGIHWSEVNTEWQKKDWRTVSMNEFEQIWKRSEWAGRVNW